MDMCFLRPHDLALSNDTIIAELGMYFLEIQNFDSINLGFLVAFFISTCIGPIFSDIK